MFVRKIKAGVIRNSRKEKSIEITLKTYEGTFRASAPSGKSRGKNEVEPYNKHGIGASVELLKRFFVHIKNKNYDIRKIKDLENLEKIMSSFQKKYGEFGGNVTYALETVFLKAAAKNRGLELWELINMDLNPGQVPKIPMPVGNCIGGGLHSGDGKRPDFQEFLLIPDEKTFSKAITLNYRAYKYAGGLIGTGKRNDEGAWKNNKTNEEVLEILSKVAKRFGLRIGLDVASSTFYKNGYYYYKNKELIRDKVDQMDYMARLIKKYDIFYSEDPIDEEDFQGFKQILNSVLEVKKKSLIVGDDLTTTKLSRVRHAFESGAINATIIKPNQIGSIVEVKKVVEFCKINNIKMIFSHRSGETMDNALADYCVGFGGDFIKCGIYGPERLIKLKRVLDIEKKVSK